jgi:hypothetical protein
MMQSSPVVDAQARLARARSDLDQLGHARTSEKYMECYFLVEALELQLQRLLDEAPRVQG